MKKMKYIIRTIFMTVISTTLSLLVIWYKALTTINDLLLCIIATSTTEQGPQTKRSTYLFDCSPQSTEKLRENFRKQYLFSVLHCNIFQPIFFFKVF